MKKLTLSGTVAACFLAVASGAHGQSLEECELTGQDNEFLCATALEFGTFAATVRDTIGLRSGGVSRSQKAGNDQGTPWFGIASANAQRTQGSFSGYGATVMLGADRAVSTSFSVGGLVTIGRGSLTPASGTQVEREEVLIGPYFSNVLGNGDMVSGYFLYGTPKYTVNSGAPYTGQSVVGSVSWTRPIARDGVDYAPFVALSVKREEPSATDRVDATIVTFGSSFDGEVTASGSGFRQVFGRLELDVGDYRDSFGNSVSYVAPRVGVGMRHAFENGGMVQLQANVSAATDRTAILAAQVNYRFEF